MLVAYNLKRLKGTLKMASNHSDFIKGTMGVSEHKKTFGGFMGFTVYGGAAVALIVLYPTLVFGTPLGWLPSLIATLILGFILGAVFKLKGGWYVGMIASAIPVGILSLLLSVLMN